MKRQVLRLSWIRGLAYRHSQGELRQGEDDVVPPLDLCELLGEEAEEGEETNDPHILEGVQDALSSSEWRVRGRER